MEVIDIPTLSVFDARSALWRHRKREWLNIIGVDSTSRENVLYGSLAMRLPGLYSKSREERERLGISFDEYVKLYAPEELTKPATKMSEGTSTFDPVLAEIIYNWFTPYHGARVFDCFAGDCTKGAVAVTMKHQFIGIEIREPQVDANLDKVRYMANHPRYFCGDARNILRYIGLASQDLLISCPPYYNLEVYSDLPDDASNQPTYEAFIALLKEAYSKAVECLKRNRFAVIIVGDIRDDKGSCYNFPGDIISIFQDAGCSLINDAVIVKNDATANMRATRYMKSRKLVRIHERMLVFYKGNPSSIKKYFNPIISPYE